MSDEKNSDGGEGAGTEGDTTTPAATPDTKKETILYGADDQSPPSGDEGGGEGEGTPEPAADWKPEDLKIPEDSGVSEAQRDEIVKFAKDNSVSKDAAAKLLEREVALRKSFQENINTEHDKSVKSWADETRADKEVGGENFDASVKRARGVINQFGSPELKEFLNDSGFGNHKLLVKFCNRIGKAIGDDTFVKGKTGPSEIKKSAEEVFYPDSVKK